MDRQIDRQSKIPAQSTDFRLDPHLVIMTIEPLTPIAKTWIEENTEPWQWQDDRLCVPHAIAMDILCRIARDGLSYRETPIEMPDERAAGERLLQERNWVRVMPQSMPRDLPRREDAIAVIEQALQHVGFSIQ
jgi:hypothetical protein